MQEMNPQEKEENEKKLILLGYKRCSKCNKLHKHTTNSKDRTKKLCNVCKRYEITNIAYIPFNQRRKERIGKFSLSYDEKKLLVNKLVSEKGFSYNSAWRIINSEQRKLQGYKKMKYFNRRILKQMNEEKLNADSINKQKFLEGIK